MDLVHLVESAWAFESMEKAFHWYWGDRLEPVLVLEQLKVVTYKSLETLEVSSLLAYSRFSC